MTKILNDQLALSVTSATVRPARGNRRSIVLKNLDGGITIYVGTGTITSANGMELKPGESIELFTTDSVDAIAASGTPTVAYIEEFD